MSTAAMTPETLALAADLPSSKLDAPSLGSKRRMPSKESTVVDSDATSVAAMSDSSFCGLDADTEREETLIFLDWDDTLCPTTHQEAHPECAVTDAVALEEHAQAVEALLRVAANLGRVAIVTMAAEGWIQSTIQKLMPSVKDTMDELQIPVSLAREGVSTRCMREAFADERSPSHFLKRRAMAKAIREAAGSKNHVWKHIVSIGDSEAEQYALQDLMMCPSTFAREGGCSGLNCKTVKLMSEPTLAELTAQVRTLAQWLPTIARHDGDLDFHTVEDDLVPR